MSVKAIIISIVVAGAGLGVILIVGISPQLASVQSFAMGQGPGNTCTADAIPGFRPARPSTPVPDATFSGSGGRQRTIADYRGQGVVVNFWATWCAPCVREMPALDRMQAAVMADGIKVVTLSEDRGSATLIKKFFSVNGIRNLPDFVDKNGAAMRSFGVSALPTTILINREGRETGRLIGTAEWDRPEIIAAVRSCLGSDLDRGPLIKGARLSPRSRNPAHQNPAKSGLLS